VNHFFFKAFQPFLKWTGLTISTKPGKTMKFNRTAFVYTCLTIVVLSCNDNDNDPEPSASDLSQYAQEFMGIRMGSPNTANKSNEMAINRSFQSMMGARGLAGGRVAGDSAVSGGGASDSTIYTDPWASCAVITTTENSDGSTTTIYDYGDGCEEGWGEYIYFMHGKTIQTYKYTSKQTGSVVRDTYLFKMIYDNYGGSYNNNDSSAWSMDGNSHYEGYSQYDTTQQKFSGAYAYNDTSLYQSRGGNYVYKSAGRSSYDETGWIIEQNDYEYGDGTDFYRSRLAERLVYNYSCNVFDEGGLTQAYIWVAVSGKEIVTYSQEGKQGSFEVDYGDGECDNVIYITENGIRVRVDLGTGWLYAAKEG
jgi:hypothetical protein